MKVSVWFAVAANLIGLIVGFFVVCANIATDPGFYRGMCDRLMAKHSVNYADYAEAKTEE